MGWSKLSAFKSGKVKPDDEPKVLPQKESKDPIFDAGKIPPLSPDEVAEKLLTPMTVRNALTSEEPADLFLAQIGKKEEKGGESSPSGEKAPAKDEKTEPEATSENKDNTAKKNGLMSDIFEQADEVKESPVGKLIASLPAISIQELLSDVEQIKTLMHEQHQTGNQTGSQKPGKARIVINAGLQSQRKIEVTQREGVRV